MRRDEKQQHAYHVRTWWLYYWDNIHELAEGSEMHNSWRRIGAQAIFSTWLDDVMEARHEERPQGKPGRLRP